MDFFLLKGTPDFSYHGFQIVSVPLLSQNLHEMVTFVQIIRENGGLQRLIAFIMDTSPPEEDDKKGKKPVEKGASRTGKKGKGEDSE